MSHSSINVYEVSSVSMDDVQMLSSDGRPFWIRHFYVVTQDGSQVSMALFAKSPEALDLVKV